MALDSQARALKGPDEGGSAGLWASVRLRRVQFPSVADRIDDSLRPSGNVELPVDTVQVGLCCLLADEESFSNLPVLEATHEKAENLVLPAS